MACYTRAPAPGGRRGLDLVKSPVHQAAERFGIPVLTPKSLRNAEAQAEFASFGADAAIVVAYGLILPVPVLEAVPLAASTSTVRPCPAGAARPPSSAPSWPAMLKPP